MGLLTGKNIGKDIFNSKYTTAQITDSFNYLHFIEIKNTLGDYFLVDINHQIYAFKLLGERVKTCKMKAARSFKTVYYDTNNYMPISAKDNSDLEELLKRNSLPKVTNRLYSILNYFGKREKDDKQEFTPHSLKDLVDLISTNSDEYKEEAENIKNYLENLNVNQIVTPVKKITEFLEGDFKATDPKYFGTVMTTHLSLELEHKKLTNSPITAKKPWLKMAVILLLVAMLGIIIYYAYSSGAFSHIFPTFPSINNPGQSNSISDLTTKYPTPEAMKAAIARGELDYNSLPDQVKKMVDQVKTPVVTPGQH